MITPKERAAKAIAARKMCLSNNGARLPDDLWMRCLPDAEAALAAIAEPSDAMIEAGENAGCGVSDFRTAAELTWRAMHAAMMAEKDTRK